MKIATQMNKTTSEPKQGFASWLIPLSWGITVLLVAFMLFLLLQRLPSALISASAAPDIPQDIEEVIPEDTSTQASLPEFTPLAGEKAITRSASTDTVIPSSFRNKPDTYTVRSGDSVFGIATSYKLKPETVLWANYDLLNDNPNMLSIDQVLTIPPADGIYYKWKEGDTLEKVAETYKASARDILSYPGNGLDLTAEEHSIEPGTYVMIPGGWRENQQWLVPTVWRSGAGANQSIPGACDVSGGLVGSGYFIWPADNHYLSGNDFWSGHLGLDIAAGTGAPIYASDSGVVVYAAPIGGGYGNMVMIDHGNGFHTLYAHLDSIAVGCGQSVVAGNVIGYAGSTGNSTGPHLHFEIRQLGAFINPWHVLP